MPSAHLSVYAPQNIVNVISWMTEEFHQTYTTDAL